MHEFQAFLPHLDAFSGPFDLRVRTCRQLCRSTVLTHLKTKGINMPRATPAKRYVDRNLPAECLRVAFSHPNVHLAFGLHHLIC